MTQLRSPLMWRLILWLVFLSIIPLVIVYAFMQRNMRDTYSDAQLEILTNQVRMYSARLENNPGEEQRLTTALSNISGESVFFLIGTNGRYIAHSDPTKVGMAVNDDLGPSLTRQLLTRGSETFIDEANSVLIASYRASFGDPIAVSLMKMDVRLLPLTDLTNTIMLRVAIGLFIVALCGGLVMLYSLRPAIQLGEFAKQLGEKNFLATLNTARFKGELGLLAKRLMDLSINMQSMLTELEQRVVERAHELELRAVQLKAAADVGKAITSVRNLSELLQQTTVLINERFNYYHVGIFLLDERKEYAILSASNSEGGKSMLEKKHQLKVGETGIVGYVTQNARARIALDVGTDAVYFDNPDLPSTRSEMALPLVASGQILGALDVQSTQPQAFSDEDVATLQILADQLAVAIQNANLFNETEKALEAARQVYGDLSRDAWRKVLRSQPRIGFLATPPGIIQTENEVLEPSLSKAFETGDIVYNDDGLTISIPIKVRGQSIGAIRLKKPEISEAWTQDETNLAISLSDQLSGALESARLYRESQQRAARESLVSDISARISATSRVESIIRETVQELGQTLGNATVTFQLMEKTDEQYQAEGSSRGDSKSRKDEKARE